MNTADNNLQVTKVNLQNSLGQSINSSSILQNKENITCRICLENQTNHQNPLIAPCQCRGSVQYVHESCQCQWIRSNLEIYPLKKRQQMWNNKQIQCELCSFKIPMEISRNLRMCTCEQFKNGNLLLFGILIFFMFAKIAAITYFSILIKNDLDMKQIRLQKVIVSSLLLLLFVGLLITNIVYMLHSLTRFQYNFKILAIKKQLSPIDKEQKSSFTYGISLEDQKCTTKRTNTSSLQIYDISN